MYRIRDNLYVSDWQEALRSPEFVRVTVAYDSPFMGEHVFGMVDGRHEDNAYEMDCAVAKVRELMAQGRRVLVHCVAGRSRSPAVVVGVLMSEGMSLVEALLHLWERHPEADPRLSLLEKIVREGAAVG